MILTCPSGRICGVLLGTCRHLYIIQGHRTEFATTTSSHIHYLLVPTHSSATASSSVLNSNVLQIIFIIPLSVSVKTSVAFNSGGIIRKILPLNSHHTTPSSISSLVTSLTRKMNTLKNASIISWLSTVVFSPVSTASHRPTYRPTSFGCLSTSTATTPMS